MAFWNRRGDKVRLFVYDAVMKKQVMVPRPVYEHLDSLPDSEVDNWVRRWANLRAVKAQNPKAVPVKEPDILEQVCRFMTYLERNEGRHPVTRDAHRRYLTDYALPYFVNAKKCEALKQFPAHANGLTDWLKRDAGASSKQIKRVNQSLGKFWRWVVEEGLGSGELVLRQLPVERSSTPLQFTLTPPQVLGWTSKRHDVWLFGMIAYFFSLRPQEVMALERGDFAMGLRSLSYEACKAMLRAGLDGGLVVNVVKQNSKIVGISDPKKSSKGVVACFDADARRLIQREIERAVPGRLFPYSVDHYYHLWARHGIPGITLKDMRRASIYWLAHYSNLSLAGLRNHARHRSIETTGLYTRRPDEDFFQDCPGMYT